MSTIDNLTPEDRERHRRASSEGGRKGQRPEMLATRIARAFDKGELSPEQINVIQGLLKDLMAQK